MATIAILPEPGEDNLTTFSAVTTGRKATGRTAGEALDALTTQLSAEEAAAPVIIQQFRPDHLFPAAQRDRLSTLMARWRAARETGEALPPGEQAELERLVDEEVEGTARRAGNILRDLETPPPRRVYDQTQADVLMHESLARLVSHYSALMRIILICDVIVLLVAGAFFVWALFSVSFSPLTALLIIQACVVAINLFFFRGRGAVKDFITISKQVAESDRQKAR